MATVIDELIVKLGLDASGFKQGQQQATQSFQSFSAAAEDLSKKIGIQFGEQLSRFFEELKKPTDEAKKGIKDVSEAAEEAGKRVEKSGKTGATGIAALTAAGLGAFSVLKGIQDIAAKISTTFSSTAAFGRIAQWAGTNPQWLSQVATAAHIATNAPKEQTTAALYGIQQDIENLALGRSGLSQRLKDIQTLGIDVISGTPEERLKRIVEELPKALQKLTLPQAIQRLGSLPPELVQFFKLGPGAVQNYLNQAGPISTTKEQTEAAQRLQTALNKLADAWESLVRTLETHASPVLTKIADQLSAWNIQLQQTPAALKDVEVAILAVGAALGFGLLAKLLKIVPALAAVVTGLQAIETFSSHGLGGLIPENKSDRQLSEEARRSAEDVLKQQERTKNMPWYQRMWEDLKHSFEESPKVTGSEYLDPNTAAAASLVAQHESAGGKNAGWNYRHNENPNYYTASGIYQQTRGNWRKYAGQAGIDTNKYPDAMLAPPAYQAQAFALQYRAEGLGPWGTAAGGSITPAEAAQFNAAHPIASQYNAGLRTIQGAQAGGTTNNSTSTSSTYDNDYNINVQTQPGADHYMIGDAVAGAIRRSTLSNQSNVGLE